MSTIPSGHLSTRDRDRERDRYRVRERERVRNGTCLLYTSANALLDQDVPVLMTNFPTILNRLTGMFSEDRSEFIASFDEYDLLIIDELGVERSTEYAMEQMFFVIDSRYRSRRPRIITTNLKLSELKNPPDLANARIYDRILERCAPILFDGKNFREENAGVTRQAAKDIVNSKHD